ncbi:hypothetical protein [Clostridium sp. Marseille-Q2269]|nr:hypothetical protein [Clostridium sp. Marseille-Q2269]
MNIKNIKLKLIKGKNTAAIVTEALLKLYENNAEKVLNLNEDKK